MKIYKLNNLYDNLITLVWKYYNNYNYSEEFDPWQKNNNLFYISTFIFLYFPGELPHGNYVIKNGSVKLEI